jgi:hypothetical protein
MIIITFSIEKDILGSWFGAISELTSCSPTKSDLHFDSSFTTFISEPVQYRILTFHVPDLMPTFLSLRCLFKDSIQF